MNGIKGFAALALGVIVVAGFVLTRLFSGAESLKAIEISAVVAFVVQMTAFLVLLPPKGKPDLPGGLLMRWGAGVVIRLLSLMFYAIVATKLIGLPAAPALVSLATFFFVTMMIEPLMLRNAS